MREKLLRGLSVTASNLKAKYLCLVLSGCRFIYDDVTKGFLEQGMDFCQVFSPERVIDVQRMQNPGFN
jgi:hypothetical protein